MSEINEQSVPAKLTVAGVLEDLSNGLTRPEISAKYSLSGGDTIALFQHPALKALAGDPLEGGRNDVIFTTPILEDE